MRRVLVADLPGAMGTLRALLHPDADIVGAQTLEDALSKMRDVDLVVCGVHFDDSRMFDLLRVAKAEAATRAVPFICFRDADSHLSQPLLQGLEIACAALGAAGFVDLYQLRQQVGAERAGAQFRALLLSLLNRP